MGVPFPKNAQNASVLRRLHFGLKQIRICQIRDHNPQTFSDFVILLEILDTEMNSVNYQKEITQPGLLSRPPVLAQYERQSKT